MTWLARAVNFIQSASGLSRPGADDSAAAQINAELVRYRQMIDVHEATIEALARAIDADDDPADDHLRRVRRHAAVIAEHLGLPRAEIEAIKVAAVLHDIGKLGVPSHILSKPGPLTAEEFEKVRVHPRVGAEIISRVPFPYPVAPLILCHHERWDGMGYPSGLKGDEIPIGARVLAAVDCFDSLRRERPYRGALDAEAALEVLRREAGKSLDPAVVDTLIALLPRLELGVVTNAIRTQGSSPDANDLPALEMIATAQRETVALYDLSRAISRGLGVADTARLLAASLHGLVPYAGCALFMADGDRRLVCRFATGIGTDSLRGMIVRVGSGPTGLAAATRQTVVNGDPAADVATAVSGGPTESPLRSSLATPLVTDGGLVGVLAVYHTEPGYYDEEHRRLIEHVSTQAAAVVSNAACFDRALEDSLTDALTGLPNTRFFLMHFTQELARAARQGSSLALLVTDLDDFKRINDTLGHWMGDRVLRQVADSLRGAIRPYDVCGRYAGDEFLIMLPECGPEEAEERRLDFEERIRTLRSEVGDGRVVSVSASIGFAVFPADGDTYEALLAVADARMYDLKRHARRTVLHPGPQLVPPQLRPSALVPPGKLAAGG